VYLGTLAGESGFEGHGVDISTAAVDAAARRYPQCEWVVANADRHLPYSAASFSIVLSITARMNAAEFRRVLRDGGRLLLGIPASDDLAELRGAGRDRVARTVEMFSRDFTLLEQRKAANTVELDAAGVEDVLHTIYRPRRARPVEAGRLTFSMDLLLFRTLPG
jgi:23S rRNA (guanine745-N1)-methyltransferase